MPQLILRTYPLIPEFSKCVDNDTNHNGQTNSCHNDEEGDVIKQVEGKHIEPLWNQGDSLRKTKMILVSTPIND